MKITSSFEIYKTTYHHVAIYRYLERDNDKVLKFYMNKFSYY